MVKSSAVGRSVVIDYVNNIIPDCLKDESSKKNILFLNKKLKTDYIIDLTSYLISQFFLIKETNVSLSSTILRKRYGVDYNLYVKYLVDRGIIRLVKNHLNGKNSRVYDLNKSILEGELKIFKNYDKILLKKYLSSTTDIDYTKYSFNSIDTDIKKKLVEDLYRTKIDESSSDFLMNSLILEKQVYSTNKYSIDCINRGQIFFHFDQYGRMHSNFTNLKSVIRKNCLFLDGEKTTEIDIKNSQPLFLNKLFNEYSDDYPFDESELQLYQHLTLNGVFYTYLSNCAKIEDLRVVKDHIYKVLFGRNYPNKFEKIFQSLFPTIYNFIKFYKKSMGSYRSLSHKLQNLESSFIYNKTIKEIIEVDPTITLVTVHDSIICKVSDYELVNQIFQKKLKSEFLPELSHEIKSEINIYSYEDAQ